MSLDIEHHFLPGLYCKLSRIAAGMHLKQHVHEYDHASHLVKGSASLSTDGGITWEVHVAPKTLLIVAGIAHEVIALTEVVWYCAHVTDETDINKIDETLIERDAVSFHGSMRPGILGASA